MSLQQIYQTIKDLKRKVCHKVISLSQGSEQATTEGWNGCLHTWRTAPPQRQLRRRRRRFVEKTCKRYDRKEEEEASFNRIVRHLTQEGTLTRC